MPTGRTLFLDRDGVLNARIMGGYVTNWSEFHWLPGVLEALAKARSMFDLILVVTNQQGVGKGFMTASALEDIHRQLQQEAASAGGRIDKIYACTSLAEDKDPRRKPGTGMIADAIQDFPDITLSQAILIGDTRSDLVLAQHAGMGAIWIDHGIEDQNSMPPFNYRCSTLLNAIDWLEQGGFLDTEKG